jgi:hypothetical protein
MPKNCPLVWLGVEKRMNVFGHIFIKHQPANSKHISKQTAHDRKEHIIKTVLRGFRSSTTSGEIPDK